LSSQIEFGAQATAIFDLSNVVARALSIAGETGCIGLFCKMLLRYRARFPGYQIVFCVEGQGATLRRKLDPNYKADKVVPAKEFNDARGAAVQLLLHTDALVVQAPDGEADDAIATFVKCHCSDRDAVIISNDRDLWQLITKRVKAYATVQKKEVLVDRYLCQKELGVAPQKLRLLKTLSGDPSDKIPRAVPRMKTATIRRLVAEINELPEIPAVVRAAAWMTDKEKEKLLGAKERVLLNYKLIKLRDNLPLKIREGRPNRKALKELLDKHGTVLDTGQLYTLTGQSAW
jgi:5'-3' exonuclease